jgi:hypothetical protein
LTNPVLVTPLKQIEMDVTIVIGIGAVTEHSRETGTGLGGLAPLGWRRKRKAQAVTEEHGRAADGPLF